MPRFAAEAPWAWRLVARYLRELPATRRTETPGRVPTVADAAGDAPIVLVQADPEAYLLPEPARRLVDGLASRGDLSALQPVSNEAESEESRFAPPFAYLTPTLLAEAVAFVAASGGAVRDRVRSRLAGLRRAPFGAGGRCPRTFRCGTFPRELGARGLAVGIDPGAYVHRYGAMDASAREDLAAKVPEGAAAVLDVGCSRGATAAALRARGARRIVGIEPDREDAAAAAKVYDEVLCARLDEVRENFDRRFDAILFGDVLEHLADPSEALVRVRPWLSATGVVVASVPNAGHWSIVDDLDPRPLRLRPVLPALRHPPALFHPVDAHRPVRGLGLPRAGDRGDSWSRPRPTARRAGIASPPFRGRARTWTSRNFSRSPKRRADAAGRVPTPLGYHRRR